MNAEDGLKWELALMGWRAAGHISLSAALAAMFVARNRFMAGMNDGDWLKVIRAIPVELTDPDTRNPTLRDILEIVDSVFDGTRMDNLTLGGLYFLSPEMTPWFDTSQSERLSTIGNNFVVWK